MIALDSNQGSAWGIFLRFAPVDAEELDHVTIEISVLGDRGPVTGPGDIEVGRHGITIDYHGRRGLLLPQVASEHGWDSATFLRHVCAKAGLPAETWQEADAHLERFTAQVFREP